MNILGLRSRPSRSDVWVERCLRALCVIPSETVPVGTTPFPRYRLGSRGAFPLS